TRRYGSTSEGGSIVPKSGKRHLGTYWGKRNPHQRQKLDARADSEKSVCKLCVILESIPYSQSDLHEIRRSRVGVDFVGTDFQDPTDGDRYIRHARCLRDKIVIAILGISCLSILVM